MHFSKCVSVLLCLCTQTIAGTRSVQGSGCNLTWLCVGMDEKGSRSGRKDKGKGREKKSQKLNIGILMFISYTTFMLLNSGRS